MKKMKTLTVNGVQYTVDDPDSVSYGQSQTLTDEQKTLARQNIGAQGVGERLVIVGPDGKPVVFDNIGREDRDNTSVIEVVDQLGHSLPTEFNRAVRIRNIASGIEDADAVNKKQLEDAVALAQQNSGAILHTPQTLTDEQKTQARENIGAEVAKGQYELIETITLEEEVSSVVRKVDTNGTAYNFSAVSIYIETPVSTDTAAVNITIRDSANDQFLYHSNADGLAKSAKATFCRIYNDHGLVEQYHGTGGKASAVTLTKQPRYHNTRWRNVASVQINTYKSSTVTVPFPVGTKITIYAIRG